MLALGVVFLVFLVALGANRSLNHVGGPGDLTGARLVIGNLIILFVGAIVIPAVLFVIWQGIRAYRAEDKTGIENVSDKRFIKQVLGLALAAGLIAAFALTRTQNNSNTKPQAPPASRLPATVTMPDQSKRSEKTAEEMAPWVVAAVGASLTLLLGAAWISRRRNADSDESLVEDDLEAPRSELHELVESSIAEIERESDSRRAVIRAYSAMESTLARHGLGRRPSEAPGEYLSRVFAVMRLSRRPGERLTELFERARFSQHTIEPEMKSESIAALGELRSELEVKPR